MLESLQVGFFRDLSGENSSSITSVEFRSVNNAELGYIIEQDKNVLEHITKSLNKAVSQNSPTLFLLNNDRFHGNLDTMIQEAVACSNAYQRKN